MRILAGAGSYVASTGGHWVEHLEEADLSCGTYSLPAAGDDAQSPHTEDEIYVVARGRATLWTPTGSAPMGPGDVAFVAAGEEHRFVDIVEDFAVLVVFGPAEYSRAEGQARVNPAIESESASRLARSVRGAYFCSHESSSPRNRLASRADWVSPAGASVTLRK